jgi:hypothetical protein
MSCISGAQFMLSGSSLVSEQMQELNRRLSSDAAGLQELDATCRTCGIPSPNNDHRLAALQMIWPVEVRVLIWLTPVSLTLTFGRQNRTHTQGLFQAFLCRNAVLFKVLQRPFQTHLHVVKYIVAIESSPNWNFQCDAAKGELDST